MVAAAVILPERYDLPGLTDSKALSAARREHLAPLIRQCALAWGLGVIWPATIDRINILQATFEAMSRAVASLRRRPGLLLVDGNKTVPGPVLLPHWRKPVSYTHLDVYKRQQMARAARQLLRAGRPLQDRGGPPPG